MAVKLRQIYDMWFSSKPYVLLTMTFALFVDTFLATFIVPILPYIFEARIGAEGSQIQSSISVTLSTFGFAMMLLSPIAGVFVDNFRHRKWPLVIGLVAQSVATWLTAAAPNIYILSFSRIFQAGAASILWIASLATIADTVGSANMGKTMGVVGPIVRSGGFLGPVVAGALLPSIGYWPTWSVAIAMVALDLILRLAMTEQSGVAERDTSSVVGSTKDSHEVEVDAASAAKAQEWVTPSIGTTRCEAGSDQDSLRPDVITPLLPAPMVAASTSAGATTERLTTTGCFLLMLRQRRIISSMLIAILVSIAYNSFNTTLALQVEEAFQWGPRQVGLLFIALAGPSVILGPSVGWLRDSIGVRLPTILGTGLATISYVLIGLAGSHTLAWIPSLNAARDTYVGGLDSLTNSTSWTVLGVSHPRRFLYWSATKTPIVAQFPSVA
ncbi:MAG: hypothetical protein Q9228_001860 [Teloschistes exilis]